MASRAVRREPEHAHEEQAHDGVLLDGHRRRVDRRGEAVETPRHREPQRRRQPGARRIADHHRSGEQVADALMTARAEDHQHPGDAPRRHEQIDEPTDHPQHGMAEADRRALQRDGAQADGPLADARAAGQRLDHDRIADQDNGHQDELRRLAGRLVEAERGDAEDDPAEHVDGELHAEVEQRGEQARGEARRLQFEDDRLGRDDPLDRREAQLHRCSRATPHAAPGRATRRSAGPGRATRRSAGPASSVRA